MIGLAMAVSLLVVLATLGLVAMFVLRWERRADRQPVAAAADRPADPRAGVVST